MGYAEGSYKRPIWIPILGVALLAALFLRPGCTAPASLSTPQGAERALFAHPKTGELYRTIKRTHPQDFQELLHYINNRDRAGVSRTQIDIDIAHRLAQVQERGIGLLAQAPGSGLAKYREAEIRTAEAIRTLGPTPCKQHMTTGRIVTEADPPSVHKAQLELHILTWETMAAGRDQPANRKLGEPAEGQWTAIREHMIRAGVHTQSIEAFFNGRGAELSDQQQCDFSIALLRAIHALPAQEADQVYASMIAGA